MARSSEQAAVGRRRRPSAACVACLVLLLLAGGTGGIATAESVFDVRETPGLGQRFQLVQQQQERGDYAAAERQARMLIEQTPRSPMPYYHLARALAGQGEHEAAIEQLDRAVERGFFNARQLATDPHFRALHERPAFVALARAAHAIRASESPYNPILTVPATVTDADVRDGRATIGEGNTIPQAQQGFFRTYVRFPDDLPDDADAGATVRTDDDPVADLLNRWRREGRAAGNHGDLYDNRDGGHSRLARDLFPQITHLQYGRDLRDRGMARSPQQHFLFNHITLGNCSMAVGHGVYWRSLPRLLMTEPRGMNLPQQQYYQNHIFVYPSHHDHRSDHGDLFPANTPYFIISQGSSGSDQPFVRALASTLAAFKPDVKQRLVRSGLLSPTLQKIFRRSNQPVRDDADYLTAAAHPTVFRADDLDVERMVRMAQAMRADRLPPLVRLHVEEETLGEVGRDYFAPAAREQLFDSPAAIARVFRTTAYRKRMVISAENSADLDGRDLTFEWVVLRGDADRITITPQNDRDSVAEIDIPYHARGRAEPRRDIASHRVDIAVFAHNGHHHSAPAFVSIYFIPGERRSYHDDGRIERIDYADPHVSRRYTDPMLALPRDWADEYFYDADGQLLGWTRVRGDERQRFTRHGARVLETDDRNRPTRARTVNYVPRPQGDDAPPRLVQQPGDTILHYEYDGPGDPLGRIARRTRAETPDAP